MTQDIDISDADLRYEHCGLRDIIDNLLLGASAAQEATVKSVLKTYHDFRPSLPTPAGVQSDADGVER